MSPKCSPVVVKQLTLQFFSVYSELLHDRNKRANRSSLIAVCFSAGKQKKKSLSLKGKKLFTLLSALLDMQLLAPMLIQIYLIVVRLTLIL